MIQGSLTSAGSVTESYPKLKCTKQECCLVYKCAVSTCHHHHIFHPKIPSMSLLCHIFKIRKRTVGSHREPSRSRSCSARVSHLVTSSWQPVLSARGTLLLGPWPRLEWPLGSGSPLSSSLFSKPNEADSFLAWMQDVDVVTTSTP